MGLENNGKKRGGERKLLTLIVDDCCDEQSHKQLPEGKSIEEGCDESGGLEQLGNQSGVGGGGDETPGDVDHGGQTQGGKSIANAGAGGSQGTRRGEKGRRKKTKKRPKGDVVRQHTERGSAGLSQETQETHSSLTTLDS